MTAARSWVLGLAAMLVCAFALPAAGQGKRKTKRPDKIHRVKRDDTLALLAAEYYGDRGHAILIMVANGMQHPRKLKPGERLKIPVNVEVTVDRDNTLTSLAEDYLGDERRASYLARFNNLPGDASLAAGQVIRVPIQVKHRIKQKVSIAALAAGFFGTGRKKEKAQQIKDYNFLTTNELSPGQRIVIPIDDVSVRESKLPPPDTESAARIAKRHEMQAKALALLPDARLAWNEGEYTRVVELLVNLDPDYLDARQATQVGILLGSAYIATGDSATALAKFEVVHRRNPKYVMSAYKHSPKVREVWKQVGGGVSEPK